MAARTLDELLEVGGVERGWRRRRDYAAGVRAPRLRRRRCPAADPVGKWWIRSEAASSASRSRSRSRGRRHRCPAPDPAPVSPSVSRSRGRAAPPREQVRAGKERRTSQREERAAGVGSVEELGLGGSFISSGHNLDRWMNLDE